MGKTALPTAAEPIPVERPPETPPRPRPAPGVFTRGLKALASLRLTVALFALSLVLIFVGTLAQKEAGIWTVVNEYFRSLYVWIPFQIFFPAETRVAGGFPYPGGWLLGGLLLANLLAAHATRFKFSWKRSGILILHAGLIVMMVSELVTGLFAVEGRMTIKANQASNFIENSKDMELAVIDRSDAKVEEVTAIPEKLLRRGGLIQHDALPFDVEVVKYMVNSTPPAQAEPGAPNPATAGDGLTMVTQERPQVSGTDTEQQADVASAYVTLKDKKTGQPVGTYLTTVWFSGLVPVFGERPQQVAHNGKTYDLSLRPERTYKPYTIYLEDFHHGLYPGTEIPKDFTSTVRLVDPSRNEDREVKIFMNNPLRYAGETFYQSGFLPGDTGTILQVVRNPGWLMPYISCVMVALGMLIHFGLHLVGFLRRRVA